MARRITWKRLNEALVIDPQSGICYWRNPNNLARVEAGDEAGSVTAKGRCNISVDGRRYYRSVLIWFFVKKRWPQKMVDHRDGDKLNDSIGNLRAASASQNQQNNRRRRGVSGIKGVSPRRGKFVARITLDQKTKHLGYFNSKEEAAAAYAVAASQMFGEFACVS
jgi:hypothetical protein